MDKEKELLENLIGEAIDDGSPLYNDAIVKQSQELDKYIVAHMRGGENVG